MQWRAKSATQQRQATSPEGTDGDESTVVTDGASGVFHPARNGARLAVWPRRSSARTLQMAPLASRREARGGKAGSNRPPFEWYRPLAERWAKVADEPHALYAATPSEEERERWRCEVMRAPKRSTLAAAEGHHLTEGDKLGSSSETQRDAASQFWAHATARHASPASLIERLDSNGRRSARGYDRSVWATIAAWRGSGCSFHRLRRIMRPGKCIARVVEHRSEQEASRVWVTRGALNELFTRKQVSTRPRREVPAPSPSPSPSPSLHSGLVGPDGVQRCTRRP